MERERGREGGRERKIQRVREPERERERTRESERAAFLLFSPPSFHITQGQPCMVSLNVVLCEGSRAEFLEVLLISQG